MKKKYMLILLAVLLLGGAVMVSVFRHPTAKNSTLHTEDSNTTDPSWSRVQAPNFGFSMYYPQDWHLTNQIEGEYPTTTTTMQIMAVPHFISTIYNHVTNTLFIELTRETGETIKVEILSSDTKFPTNEELGKPQRDNVIPLDYATPYGQIDGRTASTWFVFDKLIIFLSADKKMVFIETTNNISLTELRSILNTFTFNDAAASPSREPSTISNVRTVTPSGYLTKVEYTDAVWRLSSVTYSEGEKLLLGFIDDTPLGRQMNRSAFFTIADRKQVTPTFESAQGVETLLSEIKFSTSTERDAPTDSFSTGMQVVSIDHAISLTIPSSWLFHTSNDNCLFRGWADAPLATTTSGRYFWAEALSRDMSKRIEINVAPGVLAPIPALKQPSTNFFVTMEGDLNGLTGYIERRPVDLVQDSIYEKPYVVGGETKSFRAIITHNGLVIYIQEGGLNEEELREFISGISFSDNPLDIPLYHPLCL